MRKLTPSETLAIAITYSNCIDDNEIISNYPDWFTKCMLFDYLSGCGYDVVDGYGGALVVLAVGVVWVRCSLNGSNYYLVAENYLYTRNSIFNIALANPQCFDQLAAFIEKVKHDGGMNGQ